MRASHFCPLGFSLLFQLLVCSAGFGATHTLTINTNGSGTVSRNPTNSAYPDGSVVTIMALPASNWIFTAWSGDASGTNNPLNVTMDADKVITANFLQVPNYTLTMNISGSGSVAPPGGIFQSNTVVLITATPSNGWAFYQWSGDASGSTNPLNVTMNTNKNITAVFLQPPSISSQPNGGSVNIGSSFSFSVSATGSVPITFQWFFNNVALPNATTAMLTLTNIDPGNGGPYQVVVSNSYGSVTSAVAVLIVNCPGTNVVSVPSDAALRTAIAVGGNVRFCFSGTVTITNTISVTKNVTLDGSGTSVIISGGNAVRLFNVSTGVSFTVSNLVFADGLRLGTNGADATGPALPQNGEPAAGGAIYNAGGSVRLVSCVLNNNEAQGGNGGSGNSTSTTNAAGGNAAGGAICNAGGTVILQNVAMLNNRARGGHGGIYNVFPGTILYGGGGSANGGALQNDGGTVTVTGGILISNAASAAAGLFSARPIASGGAAHQSAGSMTFNNVSFVRNNSSGSAAEGNGTTTLSSPAHAEAGAVCVSAGSGTFDHVQFIGNSVNGGFSYRFSGSSFGNGGALMNRGTVIIGFCTLSSNNAVAGSFGNDSLSALGGALLNIGTGVVHATTFDNNAATGGNGGAFATPGGWPGADAFGGGIFNLGTLAMTNCTLALNAAHGGNPGGTAASSGSAFGGGIFTTNGMTVMNTTIASNSVIPGIYYSGGGFHLGANIANTNGTLTLRNSLVAYAGTNANAWGTIIDGGYDMSSDGSANFSSGTSFNFTDPKLLPLANNGGPTLTMALAANSPAVDWAPASGAPTTDQRGVPRPFGAGVDLGAFEAGPFLLPLGARRSGTNVNLSFFGQAGVSYRIQRSSDLLSWETEENTGVLSTNGIVLRSYPTIQPLRFYRLTLDF